jgi:hypothetical protein
MYLESTPCNNFKAHVDNAHHAAYNPRSKQHMWMVHQWMVHQVLQLVILVHSIIPIIGP